MGGDLISAVDRVIPPGTWAPIITPGAGQYNLLTPVNLQDL